MAVTKTTGVKEFTLEVSTHKQIMRNIFFANQQFVEMVEDLVL